MAAIRGSDGRFRPGFSGNPSGRPKLASVGDNAPRAQDRKLKDAIGAPGTIIFNGFVVDEEYLEDLIGIKGLKLYDKMRKGDATVKQLLNVIKLPLLSADWRVQAATEDDKDMQIADFIEYNLFEIFPFDDLLRQILTMLEYGFSLFEIIYDIVEFEDQSYVGLQELSWRKQTTIWQWALDDGSFGAKQFVPGGVDGGFKQIPGDKLLLFSNEREGNNYAGISLLRSVYKHWFYKDALYKIDAIAAERGAVGVPIVTIPVGAKKADILKVQELARNYRANEQGFVEVPVGFTFEIIEPKGKAMKDPMAAISHHDRAILSIGLAQFLTLGSQDSAGAYSLSKDQSELFVLSIEWLAKYVAQVINEDLISKLVDLNFPDATEYPALEFGRIADDNLELFSTLLPALVTSGLLHVTPEDEEHIRSMINFPDIADSATVDEAGSNLSNVDENGNLIEEPNAGGKNDTDTPSNPNNTNANPKGKAKNNVYDVAAAYEKVRLERKILFNDVQKRKRARDARKRQRQAR